MHPSPDIHRRARLQAAFTLWVLNLGIGSAVGTAYLAHVPDDSAPRTWLFVSMALVSTMATLALAPAALSLIWGLVLRSTRAASIASGLSGSLFLCLLYTDTRIYNILRYHFNAAVWNTLTTRGSGDALQLGWGIWTLAVVAIATLTAAQAYVWRRAHDHAVAHDRAVAREPDARTDGRRRLGPLARNALLCSLVLLPVVSLEKTIYAAADLERDRLLMHTSQVFPLYPRLQVGHLLDDDRERRETLPRVAVLPDGARLRYPLEAPRLAERGAQRPLPNVLILVLDSWRRDAFTPEQTPNIAAFAADARVFEDHLSAGNGTRFGIFAMMYGLHGSYWFPMLAERRSPVLVDELDALGYDLRVFSSASMNFPELRDTAWAGIGDRVRDDYPQRLSWQRDEAVAEDFEAWLERRAEAFAEAPFFSFVLIDAAHQPYHSPGGPFQPAADRLDYLELAQSPTPELVERVHNRYRNALLHADGSAGRVLAALSRWDVLDSTIVIVTGDHGEEFQENGFWGHTSNFTAEQVAVPFLMRGPQISPGRETLPTSHLDLAPTLLELLGADPALRGRWCLGENLLQPVPARRRVLAGFADLGVWTPNGILRVPMDLDAPLGPEVRDASWRYVAGQDAACRAEAGTFDRLEEECGRFLEALPLN